jgi:hypothetical protein
MIIVGHIETDFIVTYDKDALIAQQGKGAQRLLARPKMMELFEEVLQEIPNYIAPIALWDSFSITGFHHDKIVLRDNLEIGGGPVGEVFAGASEFVTGVCTIGELIDQKISEAQHPESGQMLKALFLDSLASHAIGQVRNQLIKKLKNQYLMDGKHVSIELSPGESNWIINEQALIFQLLDTESIGMRLTDSMLMIPMKSISFAFGAGEVELGREVGSRCQWCLMKDKCDHNEMKHSFETEV